jgi:hypothetical protein
MVRTHIACSQLAARRDRKVRISLFFFFLFFFHCSCPSFQNFGMFFVVFPNVWATADANHSKCSLFESSVIWISTRLSGVQKKDTFMFSVLALVFGCFLWQVFLTRLPKRYVAVVALSLVYHAQKWSCHLVYWGFEVLRYFFDAARGLLTLESVWSRVL